MKYLCLFINITFKITCLRIKKEVCNCSVQIRGKTSLHVLRSQKYQATGISHRNDKLDASDRACHLQEIPCKASLQIPFIIMLVAESKN